MRPLSPSAQPVEVACSYCAKLTFRQPYTVRRSTSGRLFCSRLCWRLGSTRPIEDRLNDLSIPEPNSGCRLFTGSLDRHGYGTISFNGRLKGAHRVAYILEKGEIPEGLVLDHLCRNTACIEVTHLEAVTFLENVMRGMHPTVVASRAGTCLRGHPVAPENRMPVKNRKSRCLICYRLDTEKRRVMGRASAARARAKKRAESPAFGGLA